VVVERSAEVIARVLHLKRGAYAGGHSTEELKLVVSSSRGLGYLPEFQEDIIHNVLDLGAISVREVMTPRNDVVSISADASLDDVLQAMIDGRHSRLPVYDEGAPERILGILHYKDLLPVWEERRRTIRSGRPSRAFRVTRLMRPHMVVPETKPLSQMLEEFRQGRSHMAMVVDEFGTISGMLTVEDVLEQLVGRIEDEHDEKTPRATAARELDLDGTTRIRDLEAEYGIEIPADAGFETLAGFLLVKLGDIPRAGQSVEFQGRRFTVTEMERNRIARVRIEKLPEKTV
jgi:CBS domain containing-hemolysin-like protein